MPTDFLQQLDETIAHVVLEKCHLSASELAVSEDFDALQRKIEQWGDAFARKENFILLRASLYQRQARWDKASDLLEAACGVYPDHPDLLYEGALLSIDAGNYRRAQSLMQRLALQLEDLPPHRLRGVVRGSGLIGLHAVALRAIAVANDKEAGFIGEHVVARTRQAARTAAWTSGLRVISLGENCFPWLVLNRWGARADPCSPDGDSVFNLAQTSVDGCASILEDKAEGLLNGEDLVFGINSNGSPIARSPRFNITFNHEQGYEWVDDGFANLRLRYKSKVANLRSTLRGASRLFVHYTDTAGDLSRLAAAIVRANDDDNYRVVILDALPEARSDLALPPRFDYVALTRPTPDYVWFRPSDFDSPEGVAFERQALAPVLRILETMRHDA